MKPNAALARALHAIWQRKGMASALLLPLSWMTGRFVARKSRRYRLGAAQAGGTRHPVIVVGNLYVGGTGKTPVVLALIEALRARGWHPGVVSRGYGGRTQAHPLTGRAAVGARRYGDEPALIAAAGQVPVAVHPRRARALQALLADYPEVDVVIADDGLQHLALARDIEIVVQDARGLGNGRLLPAGPLREPASRLADVDYIITNLAPGQQRPACPATRARQLTMELAPARLPHLASGRELDWDVWRERYHEASVGALAGIGQPQRFFSMLRAHGLRLEQAHAMPDHAAYESSPFGRCTTELVLITAKDAVKCQGYADDRVWVVEAVPRFSQPDWFDELHGRLRAVAAEKSRLAGASAA